jgi:hypothetical protein
MYTGLLSWEAVEGAGGRDGEIGRGAASSPRFGELSAIIKSIIGMSLRGGNDWFACPFYRGVRKFISMTEKLGSKE